MSEPLTLLIVDEDPVFRLGLVTALGGVPGITLLGEVGCWEDLRPCLDRHIPDIVLIDPLFPRQGRSAWDRLRSLQATYPTLALALLTASLEYDQLLAAKSAGIAAYFPKGTAIADLVAGLYQVKSGQKAWPQGETAPALRWWEGWLWGLFRGGLGEIDESLRQLNQRRSPASEFDHWINRGRQRELRFARWLVQRIMPRPLRQWYRAQRLLETGPQTTLTRPSGLVPLVPWQGLGLTARPASSLAGPGENLTALPLEVDILDPLKRQELLSLSQQTLDQTLDDLRNLRITPEQLPPQCLSIVGEMWRSVTLTFFGKYCQPKSDFTLEQIQDLLDVYLPVIREEKLNQIPFVAPLFHHYLFGDPLVVGQGSYESASAEAQQYGELYRQNLVIQVANATMVFILNYFADHEGIKVALYEQSMLSSRQVARFRNELAWHYQFSRYWLTPKAIFESQHTLFYFTPQGISVTQVYAPRQAELDRLQSLPWLVTVILELRDALSPRLRSIIEFGGNGLVFVLTQVIGRAIGLIGKGILQGIGQTWQETRRSEFR